MGGSHSAEGYGYSSTAEHVATGRELHGTNYLITGANSGIGREAARVLLAHGATVVLACRTQPTIDGIVQEVSPADADELRSRIHLLPLDLGSFASVRECVRAFEALEIPLHCLINNAGVMMIPTFETTADGIERQWGTNHMGHFLLTVLLLPHLIRSATAEKPSRVVNVSSRAHESSPPFNVANIPPTRKHYGGISAYGFSKLSNILMASELDRRFRAHGVMACSLHPGVIATNLGRYNSMASLFYAIAMPFTKSIPQGAATTLYCAVVPNIEGGAYYADCTVAKKSDDARNSSFAKILWKASERLVEEKTNGEVIPSQILAEWQSDEEDEYQYLSKWVAAATATSTSTTSSSSSSSSDDIAPASAPITSEIKPARGQDVAPQHLWVADDSVDNCALCQVEFSFTQRKHHCRFCGKIVCSACSRNRMEPIRKLRDGELPPVPERTCDVCYCARHWN